MDLRGLILGRVREEPIPFEGFMEMALYHPLGFFGGDTLRSDRAGDFLTSPEVSPLFGETLAAYVTAERDRIGEPFRFVEVGAGSGSLLGPLLATMEVEAYAVEASPAARTRLAEHLPPDRIVERLTAVPSPFRGVILANELLDNLPMALAQKVDGTWRERWVGSTDGRGLDLVDADPRAEVTAWLDRYAGPVPEGGWVEVQIEATAWLRSAIDGLDAGSIVVIDYGDTTEGLLPRRDQGTLRTYRSHHLGPDPLLEPGQTDITADVNFSALADVAREAGLEVVLERQDEFLTRWGLREHISGLDRLERAAAADGDSMERLRLRSVRTEGETLLHPRGLGDFRVLRITR